MMAITRSKRRTVGDRDGWQCHYCRIELTNETMSLDHVYPHRKGGSNANWNLVAACKPCNNGFGDRYHKCDCAFCDAAFRLTIDRAPQVSKVDVAAVAGYRWTSDGWKPYYEGATR